MSGFLEKFDGNLAATCFPDTRICFCKLIFDGKSIMGVITIKSHHFGGNMFGAFSKHPTSNTKETEPSRVVSLVMFA